ncbi:MarR family winged helix-turn-helix transcriptional regulator [Companilactobacillus sp.]|jgi:DNA-binding MarR family transcriptional regulator|uniref:MarR family winged helix-turn-helix transcriptional regulator n=1 Tax=Companilactobacillus sp. TaxID=2767905 RepID=UPI0025BE7D9D|nr:MarR family transcriptional regulator [Companilactobacillus sp.]MCH4009988.1 MarR family transcriptional regulator [Companilactobacillus sp.]MCH4052336.1 MarR family transcriptional regulator [Companilactobacillus sp.]MCH4077930.1 MarR family transcriptional regulator [Companilactobacillus sp.]MCH4126506.1 MarR family transcriptional regulator [Companilactobacillus sp.]MCH4132092.1 MarR family transcriptional regulator [Companilactobacillus sp.]
MKNIGYLAQDISILHRQYYKDTREQFDALKLNPTAACILLSIGDYPEITQNHVARLLVVDKGLATREINKMEKLGYLSKHNGVGKTKVLLLTELGQKVVDEVQSIRTKWWQQKFSETGLNSDSPLLKTIETVVDTIVEPLEG